MPGIGFGGGGTGGGRGFRQTAGDEPAGPSVLPGEYKIKITYMNIKDSTTVKVFSDPRLDIKMENLIERDKMYKDFTPKIEAVTKITEKLDAADRTITLIDEKIKDKTGNNFTELKKMSKAVKDSVKILNELIIQPRNIQGLVTNENILSSLLRRASGAITGYWDKPGETERVSLMMFENAYKNVAERINKFFETNWVVYRKAVEDAKISLFEN